MIDAISLIMEILLIKVEYCQDYYIANLVLLNFTNLLAYLETHCCPRDPNTLNFIWSKLNLPLSHLQYFRLIILILLPHEVVLLCKNTIVKIHQVFSIVFSLRLYVILTMSKFIFLVKLSLLVYHYTWALASFYGFKSFSSCFIL